MIINGQQELTTDVPSSSIRWFKLYENLTEFGKALAYPCNWNAEDYKWEASEDDERRRYVYSTIEHLVGTPEEFVPCWYNSRGRVWEVTRLGETTLLGKADASITGGATGTISVYTGAPGSETDTDRNISSVYLRYGYVPINGFVTIGYQHGKPYIISDHRTVIVKADATISKGSSGTCSIYNDETDTADNITAKALGAQVASAKWATAWQEEKSGDWLVACWET